MASHPLLTPPNLLSLSRFVLAGVFVVTPAPSARLALLITAAATDWLDGYLARRSQLTSRWGALLDPLADRAFVVVAVVVFAVEQLFTAGQLFVFLARDIATAIGFLVARGVRRLRPVAFQARALGKAVTGLQFLTLCAALVRPAWIGAMVTLIGVVAVLSVVDYTLALWRASRVAGTA